MGLNEVALAVLVVVTAVGLAVHRALIKLLQDYDGLHGVVSNTEKNKNVIAKL